MLNNRELASAILFGPFLIVAAVATRDFILSLIKTALFSRLTIVWLSYAAAITGTVILLRQLGLSYPSHVKDAVVWSLLVGLPILVKFDAASKHPELLWRVVKQAVGFTAVVEFFVNLYVFPLYVELPVQLLTMVIAMTSAVAEMNPDHAPVKRLMDGCLTTLGLAALVFAIAQTWRRAHQLNGGNLGLALLQPVVLTLTAVLVTYLLALYSAYELLVKVRLSFGHGAGKRRHRLMQMTAAFTVLHLRPQKVSGLAGGACLHLAQSRTFRDARAVAAAYDKGRLGRQDWP
ncbi:MAG TPA: hypothetical protein VFT62_07000 [Mycobacteriales bacterium]|nr:hypothetical protein [Mycobacteriales bacterium]